MGSMPFLILAALVAIYLVLGILSKARSTPITILSTIPSAGVGAVVALMLAGMQLDVIGLIAIILLIGIVKKNAILIIDFALDAERASRPGSGRCDPRGGAAALPPDRDDHACGGARRAAAGHRLRRGAELRQPLGVAIVGGLVAAQFLTLFTTPVVFLALDRFRAGAVRTSGCSRAMARTNPDWSPHDPNPPLLAMPALAAALLSGAIWHRFMRGRASPPYPPASRKRRASAPPRHRTPWPRANGGRARRSVLDDLERRVIVSNQNLAAAKATL